MRSPFFIDCGTHPRLPEPPPAPASASHNHQSPAAYAQQKRAMKGTVLELLTTAQRDRKAKLDVGRVHTVIKVGDEVLLRT